MGRERAFDGSLRIGNSTAQEGPAMEITAVIPTRMVLIFEEEMGVLGVGILVLRDEISSLEGGVGAERCHCFKIGFGRERQYSIPISEEFVDEIKKLNSI